jgi:hypothetical protein
MGILLNEYVIECLWHYKSKKNLQMGIKIF